MPVRNLLFRLILFSFIILLYACSSRGGLFGKKTPHEEYAKKIEDAGLKETALGDAWFKAAAITLSQPLDVSLPYKETGYFAAEKPNAVGLRFHAKRGEKLKILLAKKPVENFAVYLDLWQPFASPDKIPKLLQAADTANLSLEYTVNDDTIFIVRIQPELLKEGEYSLTINTGPSLAFPISPTVKSYIGSFFGAGRDNGDRKHEGIDIFAPKHSPAVAASGGVVTSVTENRLGGKVIFMRPDDRPFNLYYAHLDSQIAVEGQRVKTGDVLGLTGNTGNAQFTPSHLHFGIYTFGGAIDPLYFVKPSDKKPSKITVTLMNLNKLMRSEKSAKLYYSEAAGNSGYLTLTENTLLQPEAATGSLYRVILPDGKKGFVNGSAIIPIAKPIKRLTIKQAQPLLASPDSSALQRKLLTAGDRINVLANFNDFYFIAKDNEQGWIWKKLL
jgi:murein DD-endopeptidase MepM/ murein hydrolase activator NlpD